MPLAGDGSGANEALKGAVCGIVFGAASPLVGHPIDCVKTTMMARPGYSHGGALSTAARLVRTEGLLALYRGLLPPLLGSSVFRSTQFIAYGGAYGACRDVPLLCTPIDALGGVQGRVLVGAVASTTARTLLEMPVEYVKIRRQLGQQWEPSFKEAYRGLGLAWWRMLVALGGYFVLMDAADRSSLKPALSTPVVGPFLQGSLCATAAWAAAWPLELLRTTAQAGIAPGASALQRVRTVLRERGGAVGLYRGIGPGLLRSLVANGSATLAFTACQSCWPQDTVAGGGGGSSAAVAAAANQGTFYDVKDVGFVGRTIVRVVAGPSSSKAVRPRTVCSLWSSSLPGRLYHSDGS